MYLANSMPKGDLMWLIQGLADRDVNVGDLALMPDGGVTVVGTMRRCLDWRKRDRLRCGFHFCPMAVTEMATPCCQCR